jgi:protein-tyrosine phosphatase
MIDLHSHLLPGIDDGSQNWDESMEMARQAVADGTTELQVTHHILDNTHYKKLEADILQKFDEMKRRLHAERINLKLHLACEIYYQPDMELHHKISTFNSNGRYFLVEFPMQGIPRGVDDIFFQLILDGKTPVLAHPERNVGFLKSPNRAYEFVQRGVLFQMNAGSLSGKYGDGVAALATALMNSRLIHFFGSDGHNTRSRKVRMGEDYKLVRDMWGDRVAHRIFHENPRLALAGQEIKIPEPLPVEAVKKRRSLNPLHFLRKLTS